MTAKDILYIIGLAFTLISAVWWLSGHFSALSGKIDSLVTDMKEFKEHKLAERVAVLESKLIRKGSRR